MRQWNLNIALVLMLILAPYSMGSAQEPPAAFEDPDRQALYDKLIRELRCLVCQNQNLADSNAELARDLRNKAYQMVAKGETYDDVVEYMVARYGDFVLYRPPLKLSTIALWGLPFAGLLAVSVFAGYRVRRNSAKSAVALSDTDRETAEKLLDDASENS